jgi:hypothetical protein
VNLDEHAVESRFTLSPRRGTFMKRVLGVAAAVMFFGLAPATVHRTATSSAPLGVGDACAQTGTCKSSPNDICFVNGEGFDNREWIPAG